MSCLTAMLEVSQLCISSPTACLRLSNVLPSSPLVSSLVQLPLPRLYHPLLHFLHALPRPRPISVVILSSVRLPLVLLPIKTQMNLHLPLPLVSFLLALLPLSRRDPPWRFPRLLSSLFQLLETRRRDTDGLSLTVFLPVKSAVETG
ncbi:hypothetical protein CSUI_002329 [Cystoisospora suis]|uniref:Uncharacterized protein n=1 Tax=Cystoisospora suis TaxID=483139 RepID=A0A2C6KIF3_9APIC|nr:hypothetical protein CSUI_002329 [Cystoisospora suis]